MVHGIRAASCIKSVGICEERLSTKGADYVYYASCIVRTNICKIARLAEVYLDGGKLAFEVNICYTCPSDKTLEFGQHIVTWDCPQVCEEYF
jgi:hypothetical protein